MDVVQRLLPIPWHSQRGASVLTPGGVRLLNGIFPVSRVSAASLPTLPSIVSNRPPRLTTRGPVHLPGELSFPCGTDFLPGSQGPSGVNSSVRLRRRTLACPVRPGRALVPTLEGFLDPLRHFPPRTPVSERMGHETPRHLFRFCPPAESSFKAPDTHPIFQLSVRSRISFQPTLR